MHDAITSLNDEDLVAKLTTLAGKDRETQVDLLLHLAEMDERKLYLRHGHGSLWDFCREALRFSESMSHKRIVAARALRNAPQAVPMLLDGRLSLCTLAEIGPQLGTDRGAALLEKASGRSKREVQALVAGVVAANATDGRSVAATPKTRTLILDEVPATPAAAFATVASIAPDAPSAAPPKQRPVIKPVNETQHRVAFTADDKLVANLEKLRQLLGMAQIDEVIMKATEALLDRVDPVRRHARREARYARRKAQAKPPTPQRDTKKHGNATVTTRYVKQADRDKAHAESGGRCTYVSPTGQLCSARAFLEIDHIHPFALGGRSDSANVRALCSAHNRLRAVETFGTFPGKSNGGSGKVPLDRPGYGARGRA